MEKRTIDPWAWSKNTNSAQAVEVKQPTATLYCSGQVAIDANGVPSNARHEKSTHPDNCQFRTLD